MEKKRVVVPFPPGPSGSCLAILTQLAESTDSRLDPFAPSSPVFQWHLAKIAKDAKVLSPLCLFSITITITIILSTFSLQPSAFFASPCHAVVPTGEGGGALSSLREAFLNSITIMITVNFQPLAFSLQPFFPLSVVFYFRDPVRGSFPAGNGPLPGNGL